MENQEASYWGDRRITYYLSVETQKTFEETTVELASIADGIMSDEDVILRFECNNYI